MKSWKLISSHFYRLMAIVLLVMSLDMWVTTSYACKRIIWLEWTMKVPFPLPAVIDIALLFGPPFWLGAKCRSCSQRHIFLYGAFFVLVIGGISNLLSLLQWSILMKCMPDKYIDHGFETVMSASWLVLPIGMLLGGVTSWIGYKMQNRVKKN